ncbi:hypothetical protein I4P06_21775 [Enterobacter asburiae]|uniref:hypothetical protein n=1 Tax=Enterobacter asburiae TaxID=61645 RepID=UPI0018C29FF3|nr:hypothetical protein [Enterobacter asburiae]MBG0640611.1 hypothetical protein [Enterobacter asburiae]
MDTFGSPSVPAGSSARLRQSAASHLSGSAEPLRVSGSRYGLMSDVNTCSWLAPARSPQRR